MSSNRHRAREMALQGLYQWRLGGDSAELIHAQLNEDADLPAKDEPLFRALLFGVIKHQAALEEALTPHLDRAIKELSPVEYALLLLAGFELLYAAETPYRVIINEAIELAKTFGGTEGHKYVNGVLDKLAASHRPTEFGRKREQKTK